jgi:hypothetical protein
MYKGLYILKNMTYKNAAAWLELPSDFPEEFVRSAYLDTTRLRCYYEIGKCQTGYFVKFPAYVKFLTN